MRNEPERAFTLCQFRNTLLKGGQATGKDEFSVTLPISCPRGKPIGTWHSHPAAGGGSLLPSAQDISEIKRLGLQFLCVSVKRETKCYRVKKT